MTNHILHSENETFPMEYFERTLNDGTTKRIAIRPGMQNDELIPTIEVFLIGHNLDVDLKEIGYGKHWQDSYIENLSSYNNKEN